jgi:hypothetical protein
MVSYLVCATKSAIQNVGADLFANDNLKDEIVVKDEDSDSSDNVVKDLVKTPGVDWSTDLEENE